MVKILTDSLIPAFSNIINKSLSTGEVPIGLKTAVITPVLKKPSLDHNILKNFRPVSNLPFVSKLLERVVVKQLTHYMTLNNLHESLQSAYKPFHSTESALLKVHNDIMRAMDQQNITILLLLDLSAAFDTIDHKILLSRMESHLGISGNVLKWFQSYLSERTQKVQIARTFSAEQTLIWGVPQGSVLGPVLFLIYTLPLGDVIRRHGLKLHIYADDTQIYFCFRPVSTLAIMDGIDRIQRCVLEVQEWMAANLLKLNADKTEILILGSRVQLGKFMVNSISIGSIAVPICQKPVRNLGVMFDSMLSMEHQVVQVIKLANYHLRNINRVRDMLTMDAAKQLVHSFVTSRIDYCNGLLAGISAGLVRRIQLVQNTAARVVTRRRKFDHITQELITLHWLPVKLRIDFKVLVFVYKAIHGQAPCYLSDLLQVQQYKYSGLRSASCLNLVVPRTKCVTFGDRAFSVYGPKLWNKLPEHIKQAETIQCFRQKLKTYFFETAYC